MISESIPAITAGDTVQDTEINPANRSARVRRNTRSGTITIISARVPELTILTAATISPVAISITTVTLGFAIGFAIRANAAISHTPIIITVNQPVTIVIPAVAAAAGQRRLALLSSAAGLLTIQQPVAIIVHPIAAVLQRIHLADGRIAPGAGADELGCAHALVAIQVVGGGAHTLAEVAPVRWHEAAIVLAVQAQEHVLTCERRIIHGPGSKIKGCDAAAAVRGVRRADVIQARRVAVIIVVDCRDAVIRAAVAVLVAAVVAVRQADLCFPVAVHAGLHLAIRIDVSKRVVSIALAVIHTIRYRGAAGPVRGTRHAHIIPAVPIPRRLQRVVADIF